MADYNQEQGKRLLILASASPRRRELMQRLLRPFVAEVSDAVETVPSEIAPADTAEYLSGIKAEEVFRKHPDEEVVVIGSDTIVLLDGVIFGKPKDAGDAKRMLRALSGRTHEVRTGVTILWRKNIDSHPTEGSLHFTSSTGVSFYELDDDEIDAYVATGEPMDKAGAYGIQEEGALLVEKINGDYYTVMGFPIAEVNRRLRQYEL
jgi:septum formation protein